MPMTTQPNISSHITLNAPSPKQNICELLKTWAEQTPNKTALIMDISGGNISYRQLYGMVYEAALHWNNLLKLNYKSPNQNKPAEVVAILLGNTLDFVVHYFALLGLGVMVIPLNTRLTWPEINAILNDADAHWLVSNQNSHKTLESASSCDRTKMLSLVLCDILEQTCLKQAFKAVLHYPPSNNETSDWASNADNFPNQVNDQTVATLIYTSGTTGKPKGVMLSHQNSLADVWGNIQVIEATSNDVFITISPLFHVFGQINVLLSAMMAGASVVLLNTQSAKQTLRAIENHCVTFMAAVPTMYRILLAEINSQQSPAYDTSSLRVCHSGAAPMGVALFHQVEAAFGAPVQEGYGLSEASSIVTSNPLKGIRKPGSIGKAIPGVSLTIMNDHGQTVSPGIIGELCVSGNTVMLGYWQKSELTEQVFLKNKNGSLWLRTGDMGYWDDDGYVFLLDRRDDLINVGGVKVYPREIEEVLYQHPAVQEAVVLGKSSEHYTHTVQAFVVLKPDALMKTISARQLKQHCRKRLAAYKVPQSIIFMDNLPKGPTGKLLRNKLRP